MKRLLISILASTMALSMATTSSATEINETMNQNQEIQTETLSAGTCGPNAYFISIPTQGL